MPEPKSTTSVKEVLRETAPGTAVLVQGWVRTRRDAKDFSFLEVNDGSCFKSLQVIAPSALEGYAEQVLQTHTGACLEVAGEVRESPGKGQRVELYAHRVTLRGSCSAEEYPLQKKRHSLEFLRTIAHLRPRTNTFGAVFRVRSSAAQAIHRRCLEL